MKKKIYFLSAVLASCGLTCSAALAGEITSKIPDRLADVKSDGEWIEIANNNRGFIIVPVKINGAALFAMIDTGSPWTAISTDWAKSHSFPLGEMLESRGSNGLAVSAQESAFQALDIGMLRRGYGKIYAINMEELNKEIVGPRVNMIIGMDVLKSFVTEFDFDRGLFKVSDQFSIKNRPGLSIAPVFFNKKIGEEAFFSNISLDGLKVGGLLFDTGDNGVLTIIKSNAGKLNKSWKMTDILSLGAGGSFVTEYGRLDNVVWGNKKLKGVLATFDANPIREKQFGRIGLGLIKNFNIVIDGPNSKIFLLNRKLPPPAIPTTNTGIQGYLMSKGFSVIHVMKNSPAAFAGLKDGDLVCKLEGTTLDANFKMPNGPDGSKMRIELCDGRKMDLVRRTFY